MDRHGIFSLQIKDTDLQQCAVGSRTDEHGQVLAHISPTNGVPDRVQYVVVGDAVLSGGLTDPHI